MRTNFRGASFPAGFSSTVRQSFFPTEGAGSSISFQSSDSPLPMHAVLRSRGMGILPSNVASLRFICPPPPPSPDSLTGPPLLLLEGLEPVGSFLVRVLSRGIPRLLKPSMTLSGWTSRFLFPCSVGAPHSGSRGAPPFFEGSRPVPHFPFLVRRKALSQEKVELAHFSSGPAIYLSFFTK